MNEKLSNELKMDTSTVVKNSEGSEIVGRLLTEKEVTFIGCGGGHQSGGHYQQFSGGYTQTGGGSHDQAGDGSYNASPGGPGAPGDNTSPGGHG